MAIIAAKGTVLQREISSVFTTIGNVRNIDGPDMTVVTGEVGLLTSSVGIPHAVTGHVEGGMVNIDGFFDPVLSSIQSLTDDVTTPVSVNWKILYSDGATTAWPFAGIMAKFKPSARFNDFLRFDAGVKLNGIPTLPT